MKVEEIREGLWTFPIALPNNPLKWLNCYVIKGEKGGRNLLIDTGFALQECLNELIEGMQILGISPDNTDVFITHLHPDHIGNVPYLYSKGSRIFMSQIDYNIIQNGLYSSMAEMIIREGISSAPLLSAFASNNPAGTQTVKFEAEPIEEGHILRYGGYCLRCILTPGHTPGHMCLYDEDKKIVFLGDHILFDISPNIGAWCELEDALGVYLDNLRMMKRLDVELALPAHRTAGNASMRDRIDQLSLHHKKRLEETERIILENPCSDAYQIAEQMTWHIKAENWKSFPLIQKWFAYSETIAHLEHLAVRGRITRQFNGESMVYVPIKQKE